MSCNNVANISLEICDTLCKKGSNFNNCMDGKTGCINIIKNELNPVDITNNFMLLNRTSASQNTLQNINEKSNNLFTSLYSNINAKIDNIEESTLDKDANCKSRIGSKWVKIMKTWGNPEIIQHQNINYIENFKKYSAFGIKWYQQKKNFDTTNYKLLTPDTDKTSNISLSLEAYNYLQSELIKSSRIQNFYIYFTKKELIDNKLLHEKGSDLIINPNSYIIIDDEIYTLASYIRYNSFKKQFNDSNDFVNLELNSEFQNHFLDLTHDDFIINDVGHVYIPIVGCLKDEEVNSGGIVAPDILCQTVEDILKNNCYVLNNKINNNVTSPNNVSSMIKRKDLPEYLLSKDGCINKALKFDNKNELFDMVNLVLQNKEIKTKLNSMMGRYDETIFQEIRQIINNIFQNYSEYFNTNDFISLFTLDTRYWIKVDYSLLTDYINIDPNNPTGEYDAMLDFGSDENVYNIIAKNIHDNMNDNTHEIGTIVRLFDHVQITKQEDDKELLTNKAARCWFKIKDSKGVVHFYMLYIPFLHYNQKRYITFDSSCYDKNANFANIGGIDYYTDVINQDGEKQTIITTNNSSNYGLIGKTLGYYYNNISDTSHIKNDECNNILNTTINASTTRYLDENIQNFFDNYTLKDDDLVDYNALYSEYKSNIDIFSECVEKIESHIDLNTYTTTNEYSNINSNIKENAEINKKYNLYLTQVNKYDGTEESCKYLKNYNNIDNCSNANESCVSNELISDVKYEKLLQAKEDTLKKYIFSTQKSYYVNNITKYDLNNWLVKTERPTIGVEIVNSSLLNKLDEKYNASNEDKTIYFDQTNSPYLNELITIDASNIISPDNIDNNSYIYSTSHNIYYVINYEQTECNVPNNYVHQDSDDSCVGAGEQCTYVNEYSNSIAEISKINNSSCATKFSNLDYCHNYQIDDVPNGKYIDYSPCNDANEAIPILSDCVTEDPECNSSQYITYKMQNGKYTC